MLSESELNRIMDTLKLSPAGRSIVKQIRSSQPTRRVDGGAGNVACRYPSKKMRRIIQAESHKNELAAVYLWDHDSVTYEFYDQPSQIKLNYVHANGKNCGHITVPDFFIIQDDFIGWVECKTEEWLQKRVAEQSTLFVKASDGSWVCPAGSAYAKQYGLGFKLRSSNENPWIFLRNLAFLSDYWTASTSPPQFESKKSELFSCFVDKSWHYLSELLHHDANIDSDVVFRLIAQDELFVNLHENLLAEPETTKVFRNRIVADAYSLQAQSSQTSLRVVQPDIFAEKLRTQAEEVISRATPLDLVHAVTRYQLLEQIKEDSAAGTGIVSDRTLRHWKQLRRKGEAVFGDGFMGLISRVADRGNSNRKIDERVIETMKDVIENDVKGSDAKSKTVCYGLLRVRCLDLNLIPPSEKTFRREIKRAHSLFELTSAREGSRAAYKHQPFFYILDNSTPRHGDRPFEIGHIDHTELDLQFVGSKFGEKLKRAWLTVLLDAYSRAVLACVIIFDPPSYRSCMLVMRECVRRHNRVPSTIVVDRGAEFDSVYFETLLARLETMKKSRPPQKPRFGSIMERFFGISNTQLIHNLRGNNKALQTPRQMSSTHDPRERAVWTLAEFTAKFEYFVYEIYGNLEHSTLGVSPNTALRVGLAKTGLRANRLIPFTPDLALLCLPSTPKGTARINPTKGVKIGYLYYFHPMMRDHQFADVDVPVRYDPFELSTGFAYIDGTWRPCTSERANVFQGRTEREIAIIAGEINGKNKMTGKRRSINAEIIARYIMQLEGTEEILLQQKRDGEYRLAHGQSETVNDDDHNAALDIPSVEPDDAWNDFFAPSFGVFK